MSKILDTNTYFDETAHLIKIDNFFNEAMKLKLADMVGLRELFDEETVIRRNSTQLVGTGLTGVTKVNEGEDFPEARKEASRTITHTKSKYGADVVVTFEAKLYDEYNQVRKDIRTIVDDGMDKIDQSLAEILLRGFATTPYTSVLGERVNPLGQAGRALFNSIDDNIIKHAGTAHPTLSSASLTSARVQGLKHKRSTGVSAPIKYDTLIVGPALEAKAIRLTNSELLPGTNKNDVNTNKGKFKPLTWERLGVGYIASNGSQVDTDQYWFVCNKARVKDQLLFEWSVQPVLEAPVKLVKNQDDVHKFYFLFSSGFLNESYIAGSQGTYVVEDEPIITKVTNLDEIEIEPTTP